MSALRSQAANAVDEQHAKPTQSYGVDPTQGGVVERLALAVRHVFRPALDLADTCGSSLRASRSA
jgi:hypothetical protein